MKPENKAFLEVNEHYFITLRDAGYMKCFDGNTRSGMARVITEEFQPGYATDMWCPPCVADMVRLLYRYYHEWKEKHAVPVVDELHQQKAQKIDKWLKAQVPVPAEIIATAQEDFKEPLVDIPAPEQVPDPPPIPVKVKATFPSHKKNNRR